MMIARQTLYILTIHGLRNRESEYFEEDIDASQ